MKPVSFEKQMMSKAYYPCNIFWQQPFWGSLNISIEYCGYFLVLFGEYSVIGRVYTNHTQSKMFERL